MNARQYLKQAYRLTELINSDLAELDQLKALSIRVSSPSLSSVPAGNPYKHDASFVNVVIKIAELEKEIDAEIDRFIDLKKEIREVINQIPDNNQKLCLKLRYIQFLKWEEIADEMGLSMKQMHRIHNEALKNIKIPIAETK